MTLAWVPPCDNGSAITFYKLEMDDGRGGDFQHVYGGQAELQSAVITGLQSGLHYRVRLRAENGVSRCLYGAVQHSRRHSPMQAAVCMLAAQRAAPAVLMLSFVQVQLGKSRLPASHSILSYLRPLKCCRVPSCAVMCCVSCRRAAACGQPSSPSAQQPHCQAVPWR